MQNQRVYAAEAYAINIVNFFQNSVKKRA